MYKARFVPLLLLWCPELLYTDFQAYKQSGTAVSWHKREEEGTDLWLKFKNTVMHFNALSQGLWLLFKTLNVGWSLHISIAGLNKILISYFVDM